MTIAISKKIEMIYNNGQPDVIRSIRQHLSTMTTYNIIRIVREKPKRLTMFCIFIKKPIAFVEANVMLIYCKLLSLHISEIN